MTAIDRLGFLTNHLLSRKQACRVATTANITLEGTQTIDGVAVVADDRVLVKDQTNGLNGIMVCKTGEWEFADDFDQRGHVVEGTKVFVLHGTTNALTEWYVTTTGRPWPGREAIAFAQLVPTISNDAVTFAKMQNIASDRLLGRDTASSGDPEEITVGGGIEFTGSAGIQTGAFTGDVTKSAGGTALTIPDDTVTFAKMQNVDANSVPARAAASSGDLSAVALAASELLGRGATGNIAAIALGTNLSMSGATLNATGGGGGFTSIAIQAFTGSGTYTPTSGMDYCIVISTGAAGGGGGADSDGVSGITAGGGGGAGGTCIELFSAATIGANQTVTIGAGGTAGTGAGGTGGTGGDTTFGALHTATGGAGGVGSGSGSTAVAGFSGGAGGVPVDGTLNVNGGDGVNGSVSADVAATNDYAGGGLGGSSFWGSGGRGGAGTAAATAFAGTNGGAFGSGGGGAANVKAAAGAAGGAGAAGVVLVLEFIA